MNPWTYAFDVARLGLEAQCVMALRMMRLATGGALATREANRMVTEKAATMVDAQSVAVAALVGARGPAVAAKRALGTYKRAVRKNRRRLSRR
jgi:transcriptional regulator GlxA family with amidase domain